MYPMYPIALVVYKAAIVLIKHDESIGIFDICGQRQCLHFQNDGSAVFL